MPFGIRLQEKAAGSGQLDPLNQRVVLVHGKDQNLGTWQPRANLPGRLRAVDDRHRVVQQHDIGLRLQRLADGFLTIAGLCDDGPSRLSLQDAAEARTHHFMVVCDENSGHRFFPRAYCRTTTPSRASVETPVRAKGKCRYHCAGTPDLVQGLRRQQFRPVAAAAAVARDPWARKWGSQGLSPQVRRRGPAYPERWFGS